MMRAIDNLLNRITMYRLVEYVLIAEITLGIVFGLTGILAISGWSIIIQTLIVVFVTLLTNAIFARVFGAPRHSDSALITALILAVIIPPHPVHYIFLFWAGVLAMASKYILTWRAQHIFNPAAVAVAITAMALKFSAVWWIGNAAMLPIVVVGGFLILRKIKKFDLFWSCIIPSAVVSIGLAVLLQHTSLTTALRHTLVLSPLFFFGSIMLVEPATMPGTKRWRMAYGALVGILFSPQFHLGRIFLTPEQALVIGNAAFFLLRPRRRYILQLQSITKIGGGVSDFIFIPDRPIAFQAGQYLELALPHRHPDSRGARRYFTIASSPADHRLRFGIKFYEKSSSFKQALGRLQPGDTVVASQLGGDFTLPTKPEPPVVFIAGGIGVTPFRSMVSWMMAQNKARPATLMYSVQSVNELAYRDLFVKAGDRLGLKTVFTLTDLTKVPAGWTGRQGYIDPHMITTEVPDYRQRIFYLSGPNSMVEHFKSVLNSMGVSKHNIKTDFFPGYA